MPKKRPSEYLKGGRIFLTCEAEEVAGATNKKGPDHETWALRIRNLKALVDTERLLCLQPVMKENPILMPGFDEGAIKPRLSQQAARMLKLL